MILFFFLVNESLVLSLIFSLKVEFGHLKNKNWSWYSLAPLVFSTWPKDMVGSCFNGQCLQMQRGMIYGISSLLKRLKTHLVISWWIWQWMPVFNFQSWFYSVHFIKLSNFVSNLIFYILKYDPCQWSYNDIPSSLTVKLAFLVG